MYRTVQQNIITQETYHAKWNGENKTSIILRSWLFSDIAQWRLLVTFHNIGNKPPTYTQWNPTKVNISFIPWQKPEITQIPIHRISHMVWGSLASCSCRISVISPYFNINTHSTARNCAKCSLTAGRVHTTATIYIIFMFPSEMGDGSCAQSSSVYTGNLSDKTWPAHTGTTSWKSYWLK